MARSVTKMKAEVRYVRLTEYKRIEAQCKAMYKVLKKIAKSPDCQYASCGYASREIVAKIDGE